MLQSFSKICAAGFRVVADLSGSIRRVLWGLDQFLSLPIQRKALCPPPDGPVRQAGGSLLVASRSLRTSISFHSAAPVFRLV